MSNSTAAAVDPTDEDLLLVIGSNAIVMLVMFGVACTVSVKEIRRTVEKTRYAFAIGLASQIIFMPACTYCVVRVLDVPKLQATALMILGCSPGGAASNVVAVFAKADVALSIALTSVSNTLAVGTLPLLLFLWCDVGMDSPVQIPYGEIVLSIATTLIPAAGGIALREYDEERAECIGKVGGVGGAVLVFGAILVAVVANYEDFAGHHIVPWNVWVAVCLVAPLGMWVALCGLRLRSWLCVAPGGEQGDDETKGGDGIPQWVTVCIETGMQNIALALAVINWTLWKNQSPSHDVLSAQVLCGIWTTLNISGFLVFALVVRQWAPADSSENGTSTHSDVSVELGEEEAVDATLHEHDGRSETNHN